jgi:hypothetical protein
MKLSSRFLFSIFLIASTLPASALDRPKNVFIVASCDGTIGSTVLTSLREEIRRSQGYQLATRLDDDGGRGVVLTIYMSCTESRVAGMAAVAKIYGQGRCVFGCHVNSDEGTLGSLLCSSNVAVECGRRIFRDFDDYWSGPNSLPLELK